MWRAGECARGGKVILAVRYHRIRVVAVGTAPGPALGDLGESASPSERITSGEGDASPLILAGRLRLGFCDKPALESNSDGLSDPI